MITYQGVTGTEYRIDLTHTNPQALRQVLKGMEWADLVLFMAMAQVVAVETAS